MTAKVRSDRVGSGRTAFDKARKIILSTQEICGICGNPVDFSYKAPHPLSATVDHIIPVSKGGHPSALENLQLAHRWCNQWKRDKTVNAKIVLGEREEVVDNKNLPQHFDWASYVAVNRDDETGGTTPIH